MSNYEYPGFMRTQTNRPNVKSVNNLGNSDAFTNINTQRPVTTGV